MKIIKMIMDLYIIGNKYLTSVSFESGLKIDNFIFSDHNNLTNIPKNINA